MRRIVTLVCAVVFIDTMMFGALVPLIPHYADSLELTKSQAGLLLGAYGAGAFVFGIPSGFLTARIGPRRSVIAGLSLLGTTTVLFAFSDDAIVLGLARLGQGLASTVSWTGALALITTATDRARRGELLGTVFGVAMLGYILGPVVGAIAELTSIRLTFCAVSVVATGVAVAISRLEVGSAIPRGAHSISTALRDPRFVGGLWLTFVPAVFFGVLEILTPLKLDEAGWGAVAIAAVFVGAGLMETITSPLVGRLSDRRGRRYPVRLALLGSIVAAALLAAATRPAVLVPLAIVSAFTFSWFSTPGMALVADRAERAGLPQGLAFGTMNTAWAFGAMAGPAAGAALAHATSDAAPYLVCAALCAATFVAMLRTRAQPESAR
ncbi:MAG: MFS transporter [Gaiellales bacterium]